MSNDHFPARLVPRRGDRSDKALILPHSHTGGTSVLHIEALQLIAPGSLTGIYLELVGFCSFIIYNKTSIYVTPPTAADRTSLLNQLDFILLDAKISKSPPRTWNALFSLISNFINSGEREPKDNRGGEERGRQRVEEGRDKRGEKVKRRVVRGTGGEMEKVK